MGLLDSYQKQREKKEKEKQEKESLMICQSCGNKMVDNSFLNGRRMAGSFDCLKCGVKIMF